MSARSNFVLRGTVFHFRRGIPGDLRKRIGRRELVRSLATSDARTAKLRACQLYVASESLFSALRAMPMLTDAQLARLVQDFYGLILDGENRGRLAHGAIPNEVRERRVLQYEMIAVRNRDALACNRLEEAGFVTEQMLRKQGIAVTDLSPTDLAQARQAMLRAGIDVAEAIRAQYQGDFNFEPRDRLLKMQLEALASGASVPPTAPPDAVEPEPQTAQHGVDPLSIVGAAFRATQVATGAWDRQTASQASATFRLFVDVCGDRPLSAYSRKDAGRFRERIERLPNDYGKHPRYRDLTVEKILAASDALPAVNRAPLITQKTVKRHFSALSALWTAAVAKDEAATNIFAGFRFANSRKASEQRDMWERVELARLFATPIWTGCASAARRTTPGSLILRDEKFWLPLIAVFTGMRQEEICQLHVEDIRQDDDVWFIDINDRPPRKVKNATAVRRVPIHSEMIRLGFLAHVEKHRRIKQQRIEGAAASALADTVVARLPAGYDQRLGRRFEDGVDLSGGEWQKLAIARAYMRESEVLVLDEPTAALDARAEAEVFARLRALAQGRTALLISHRFSSVRRADRIVVLGNGRVQEAGTHEELVARGGRYAELFELQAAAYR